MKYITLLLISLLFSSSVFSQSADRPTSGPSYYFNSFYDYQSSNVDSAMHYLRLLGAEKKNSPILQELIHNHFAQFFQNGNEEEMQDTVTVANLKKQKVISNQVLHRMMADSLQALSAAAKPLFAWVQAQQNERETAQLESIGNDFLMNQLSTGDIHNNRVARYGLLIYRVIQNNGQLDALGGRLLNSILDSLKNHTVMQAGADTLSYGMLAMRSWYRYLYAYGNFITGCELLKDDKVKEAGKHLLEAYEYSPDKIDRNYFINYFYDMHFLVGKEKTTFQDDYIEYIKQYSPDKKEALTRLLSLSLADPTFKKELKAYYTENFPHRESFPEFWKSNINNDLTKAPSFTLTTINGYLCSLEEKKGKWLLLDLWGTWCRPCREEHPELQKLYNDLSSRQDFELLTIACNDDVTKVRKYMQEKGYSFPVAMSDNQIEKIYPVKGYPSKFLITPEGNFLTIPYGVDWVKYLHNYMGLEN